MPNRRRVIFLCVLACCTSSGCATMLRGTTQAVEIVTNPPGANVSSGNQKIVTPGKLILPRIIENTEIKIAKEGYVTQYVQLSRQSTYKAWLNTLLVPVGVLVGVATFSLGSGPNPVAMGFIFGGPFLGPAIDYGSGAVYDLDPESIEAILKPENLSIPNP